MSIWARVGPDAEQRAVHSLRDDLASGRWAANRDLSGLDAAELGLRLLAAFVAKQALTDLADACPRYACPPRTSNADRDGPPGDPVDIASVTKGGLQVGATTSLPEGPLY